MTIYRNAFAAAALQGVLGLFVWAGSSLALAWGPEGHQVIASLAEPLLTPAARQQVGRLLALEPGATLASVANWADESRSVETAAWHYVNFPRHTCVYDAPRDCPDGNCLVEAIAQQVAILQADVSDAHRLTALKYLVHLVGDLHQPLHAGYRDDRGGNTYQLQVFMRGSNLHAFWDSGLIYALNENAETLTARLSRKLPSVADTTWTAAQAAQESCSIVRTPGFYPERRVGGDYIQRFTPVVEQRLQRAGSRLAGLLNRLWNQ